EFVRGTTLDAMGQSGIHPFDAARIMGIIARAIHYVHQEGILHRDLKPTNILVDLNGRPRITDFGLAYREDGPIRFTITGQVLGSPGYISPEQVRAKSEGLTARSDVYSLGAVLYFLLTQRAPYVARTPAEVIQAVLAGDPPAPRRLNPSIPKDLETICLGALAREPSRRYVSAAAMAEDLERWISGKPISRRPAGVWERLWMLAKRHPVPSLLAVFLLFSLLAGTAGILHGWRTSKRMQEKAEAISQKLLDTTLRIQGSQAEAFFREGRSHEALTILASSVRLDPSNTVAFSRLLSALTYRDFALPAMPHVGPSQHSFDSVFTAGGSRILTWDYHKEMRLWDAYSGQAVSGPMTHFEKMAARGFGFKDSILLSEDEAHRAYFWDGKDGKALGTYYRSDTACLAIDPVNPSFAAGLTNGEIRIASVFQPERVIKNWRAGGAAVSGIDYTKNGVFLITSFSDGKMSAWDATRDFERVAEIAFPVPSTSTQISPNGELVLAVGEDEKLRLWERRTGQLATVAVGGSAPVETAIAFTPDGLRLAVGLEDGRVEV
ncbi:MAG TPA: serine/threonine-protein kinase, partial [Verrucomicrobiae bacterium]